MASASQGSSTTARIRVVADDATNAAFSSINQRLLQLERTAERTNQNISRGTQAAARQAERHSLALQGHASRLAQGLAGATRQFGALTAAYMGGRMVKEAVQDFAKADRELTRIGITSQATPEQLNKARLAIRKLADETAQSAAEVTEGLNALVVGGMEIGKAMEILPEITRANQAMGASMKDTADTAVVMSQNMQISNADMMKAFDMMAEAANRGKFEAKDFAAAMPSLGAAAARMGITGTDGMSKLVTMLEIVRREVGTSGEAVTAVQDLMSRGGQQQFQEAFGKHGINLQKEMDKTRRAGGDQLDTFTALADEVLKKEAQLRNVPLEQRFSIIDKYFPERDSRRAISALLKNRDAAREMRGEILKADGSNLRNLQRVLDDPQAKLQRLSNAWTGFKDSLARGMDKSGSLQGLDTMTKILDAISYKLEQLIRLKTAFDKGEGAKELAKMNAELNRADVLKAMGQVRAQPMTDQSRRYLDRLERELVETYRDEGAPLEEYLDESKRRGGAGLLPSDTTQQLPPGAKVDEAVRDFRLAPGRERSRQRREEEQRRLEEERRRQLEEAARADERDRASREQYQPPTAGPRPAYEGRRESEAREREGAAGGYIRRRREEDAARNPMLHPMSFDELTDEVREGSREGTLKNLYDETRSMNVLWRSMLRPAAGTGGGGGDGLQTASFRTGGGGGGGGGGDGGGGGGGGSSGSSGITSRGARGRRGGGGGADGGGGDGGGGGGGRATGTEAQRIGTAKAAFKDQLRKEGVPEANLEEAANLLAGQALQESGLDPTKTHDKGTGYGIYGARLERRAAMFAWMRQQGYDKDSLEGQAKYMAHEAMTKPEYRRSREALVGATEANRARGTQALIENFERPLDQGPRQLRDRLAQTRKAAGVQGGGAPAGGEGGAAGADGSKKTISGAAAVDLAMQHFGSHERINRSQLTNFLSRKGLRVDPVAEPWCTDFVNASLRGAGITPSTSRTATSYAKWGTGVEAANVQKGDVAVEMRGLRPGQQGGHVGLATGETRMKGGRLQIQTVGGNLSNKVGHDWEYADKITLRRATEAQGARRGTAAATPDYGSREGQRPGPGQGVPRAPARGGGGAEIENVKLDAGDQLQRLRDAASRPIPIYFEGTMPTFRDRGHLQARRELSHEMRDARYNAYSDVGVA